MKKILTLFLSIILLTSCGGETNTQTNKEQSSGNHFVSAYDKGEPLRIVAGSEMKELEPIIDEYSKANKAPITIDYLGSLDIMRLLSSSDITYDAVWPASSIWLNLGDTNHSLKYSEVTSQSPVVFGIRKSLAEELGFTDRDVKTAEIIDAIRSGKLKFTMTSATQSNSGASAYLGFLQALSNGAEGLTSEDLQDPKLREDITSLLGGVERSSGSSNWLVDLFMQGDYDAMVNYEQLIISANQQLEQAGREPLYAVYPVDGLSISDSPLAYVDKGDDKKEEAFRAFQDYILSDDAQAKIEQTGKRSAFGTVREANREVYKPEWGINIDKTLSPIRFPKADVIMEALNMYQVEFKKPGFTIYVLDYSGSMNDNNGYEQVKEAMNQVLVPANASKNLLLGTSADKTYVIPFNKGVQGVLEASGNSDQMAAMYQDLMDNYEARSSTYMYEAVIEAVGILENNKDILDQYSPAIVVLSDGMANGKLSFSDLEEEYAKLGYDVPIFGILFGDAEKEQLEQMAGLSRARVFDGRDDMIKAFQNVKGYN